MVDYVKIKSIIEDAETTGKLDKRLVKKFIPAERYEKLINDLDECRSNFDNKPKPVLQYAQLFKLVNFYNTKADNATRETKSMDFRIKAENAEERAREIACEVYGKFGHWFKGSPFDTGPRSSSPYQHTLPLPIWYNNDGEDFIARQQTEIKLGYLSSLIHEESADDPSFDPIAELERLRSYQPLRYRRAGPIYQDRLRKLAEQMTI